MFGFICLIRGEYVAARENLELVCSYHRSDLSEPLTTLEGEATDVMANIYLSCVLWFLGYPEQSDRKMALAHSIAEERGMPINLAFVCFYQMLLSLIKHDISAVERFADRLVVMSEQFDIGFTLIAGHLGQAYVIAYRNPTNLQHLDEFQEFLSLYREKVSRLSQPLLLSLKARLHIAAKRYLEAQAALSEAADLIISIDDRYTEAEVVRLQGELWTISGGGNPEEMFLRALDIAKEQKAKSFQLRSAVSLCWFWRWGGKQAEAHNLLIETYNWFSEGFVTNELQEARALLNELRPL
jgi:hypothetical protein